MSFIRLTDHVKERALKRFFLNEEKLIEFAERSVMEGFSYNDAPTKEAKKYVGERLKKGGKVYCWYGYTFIFNDDFVLITCYRLPKRIL